MTDRIRIFKREAIPGCGSFEVHLPAAVHRTAATALGDLATDSVRKRDGEAPM